MRTSVCIFFDESDARETVRQLRRDHLGVSLVDRCELVAEGEDLRLSILTAERPEHPLILSRVADLDSIQESLLRCPHCQSARLSFPLHDLSSPAKRLVRALIERLSARSQPVVHTAVCRDCSEAIQLAQAIQTPTNRGSRVIDAIAA